MNGDGCICTFNRIMLGPAFSFSHETSRFICLQHVHVQHASHALCLNPRLGCSSNGDKSMLTYIRTFPSSLRLGNPEQTDSKMINNPRKSMRTQRPCVQVGGKQPIKQIVGCNEAFKENILSE